MASKMDKPYTYNKSRRLAIIPEDFKKLISNTLRKNRDTPEPETFMESVKPPPLTIYSMDKQKPEEDFPLTTWIFELPPMAETNWK